MKSRKSKKPRKLETSKRVIWICLINGVAWVWCSYYLAYLGREQIAESLSQVAITEIIGVVLVYCVKSLFENLSKNNAWPDKIVTETSEYSEDEETIEEPFEETEYTEDCGGEE